MNELSPLNSPSSSKVRGNFVLLRADSLRLLLPQQDVRSTEYIEEAPRTTGETGIFAYADAANAPRNVLALSEQMHALAVFPVDRFLLTRLIDAQDDFSFAWNEVRVLIDAELDQHALPSVMHGPEAIFDRYLELDGELVFYSSAQRLIFQAGRSLI